MLTIESTERTIRIVYFAFLGSILLMVSLLELGLQPGMRQLNQAVYVALVVMAIVATNLVYILKNKFVGPSEVVLRSEPSNQSALKNFFTGYLITFAMCESIAIYGLVLRLIGGARVVCVILYGVGFYTLLMNRPKPSLE